MIKSAILGYPRFGIKRELKRALESFWKGQSTEIDLLQIGVELRRYNWQLMSGAGIDLIPSNDFSLYDQVLDTTAMVGAVPARYQWSGETVDLNTYFAMARGAQKHGLDVSAMEMTKWFDTNYHFIVPEFEADQTFKLASTKAVDEYREAKALGIETRPVLIGPVSYLLLGKTIDSEIAPLSMLAKLLPVYTMILEALARAGATHVQIDEPCLVLDLDMSTRSAYEMAYEILAKSSSLKIMLATYFGDLRDNLSTVMQLPVDGLHVDLVRAPGQLDDVLRALPEDKALSLGIIDGRNIWRTDLDQALKMVQKVTDSLGEERVVIAPSSSLQFCPYDLDLETELDNDLRSWLAFAKQKIIELTLLQQAVNGGNISKELENSRHALINRRQSGRTRNPAVRDRLEHLTPDMFQRTSDHSHRKITQGASIRLPDFPTTTIGSFPQTQEIRVKRAAFRNGNVTQEQYENFLKAETESAIRIQEAIGLDVLVH
ncbi:MAG: 5-methyltetrahydropteroyltriglutamate--homocysteine S-methyltransferase, partial [Anaerolineae bacterium]|nr:5-methyltetrahydropteroyltriglutamate--homocysteine S-methyltransferase [Anaerolineae bacterium]